MVLNQHKTNQQTLIYQSEKHASDQSCMTKAFYNKCLCTDLSKGMPPFQTPTGDPNSQKCSMLSDKASIY